MVFAGANLNGLCGVCSSRSRMGRPTSGFCFSEWLRQPHSSLRCVQLHNASLQTLTAHIVAAGAGLLLLFGSWTFVAAAIVAIAELFIAFSHNQDPWISVLLASLAVAIALLRSRRLVC